MLLYHGTSLANALGILKNGFDFSKCGSNWGKTYGKGIYFTPNYDTAKFYAGDDGIVLSFEIYVVPYYLEKYYSPNNKKQIKYPEFNEKGKKINVLVSPDNDEYLLLFL